MTDTKDMQDLLPCPHCGSYRITVWNIRDGQQAVCKDCKATGAPVFHGPKGQHHTYVEAVEAWNRRSDATVTALMAERDAAIARAERAERLLAEARKALEPFAKKVTDADETANAMGFAPSFDVYEGVWSFTFGELRAARAIVNKTEE